MFALFWNEKAFRELVVTGEKGEFFEATYTIQKTPTLCTLQPGDVSSMTSKAFSEEGPRLYFCMNKQQCKTEGGFTFYSKTYNGKPLDPCPALEEFCCYKPRSQTLKDEVAACIANPDFDLFLKDETPSPEFIESILRAWPSKPSPALEEQGIGSAFVKYSASAWNAKLGDGSTFYKKEKFDPLVLLAFFSYESQMGTDPKFNPARKSVGNIKKALDSTEALKQSVFCNNVKPEFGEFCGYLKWEDSIKHWAYLMEANYIQGQGLKSLRQILYKYAPPTENDTEKYIDSVKRRACEWRALWKEQKEKEQPKVMALIDVSGFLQRNSKQILSALDTILFWNADTDKDGVIDLKDKCPHEKETYNRYKDTDGCPDESEKRELERQGKLKPSERSKKIYTSPSSISGKKAILFVPIDFDYSSDEKFKKSAKQSFDKFLEEAGLSSKKTVLVADSVLEYEKIEECKKLRTSRYRYTLFNERSIDKLGTFWRSLDACGANFLRAKYGMLPKTTTYSSDYRVVGLINTEHAVFYDLGQAKGFAMFEKSKPRNSIIAVNSSQAVGHELGHTFGLAEQYSKKAFLESYKKYPYIKNFYPGPLQKYFNLDAEKASSLYQKGYTRGTEDFPECPYSKDELYTKCPDWPEWLSFGAVDCYGRKMPKTGTLKKRSFMGPSSIIDVGVAGIETTDHGFDCFEQPAIQKQWG
ncbi:MAG: hypothetical protein QXK06_02050 [Candidatus Diapherotrites archaeon]